MLPKLIGGIVVVAVAIGVITLGVSWLIKGPPDFFAGITPINQGNIVAPAGCEDPEKSKTPIIGQSVVKTIGSEKEVVNAKEKFKVSIQGDLKNYEFSPGEDGKWGLFKGDDGAGVSMITDLLKNECITYEQKYWDVDTKDIASAQKLFDRAFSDGTQTYETEAGSLKVDPPKVVDVKVVKKDSVSLYSLLLSVHSYTEDGTENLTSFYSMTNIIRENGYNHTMLVFSNAETSVRSVTTGMMNGFVAIK